MARYNEILVGRYNRFLQKFLSMKGGPPAPQLASELSATWAMFHGAENRYLEGWDVFAAATFLAAQAAATSGMQIRNPVGSNVIAVVEKVTFGSGGTQDVTVSQGTAADLATTVASNARGEVRQRANATLSATSSITTPPNLGNVIGHFQVAGAAGNPYDVINDENQECALSPGNAYRVVTNSNNLSLFVTIWWRERFLEDSERA